MDSCRPAAWKISSAHHEWGGMAASDLGEITQTDQPAIIPRSKTNDGVARAELPTRLATTSREVYGYVAEIHESPTTLNTRAPYRLVVVVQLCYFQTKWSDDSWFWAKTSAFSRNVLLANSEGIHLGSPVCGILAATYGAHLTTQMESWAPHHVGRLPSWRYRRNPQTLLFRPGPVYIRLASNRRRERVWPGQTGMDHTVRAFETTEPGCSRISR